MAQQVSLSFELIFLIQWFLKHAKKPLRNLIKDAVAQDILQELEDFNSVEQGFANDYLKVSNHLYNSVIEFIIFLEDTLLEELAGQSLQQRKKKEIIPAVQLQSIIRSIDNEKVDLETLFLSVQDARERLRDNKKTSEYEVKQEVLKEVLKNWQPMSDEPIN